MMARRVSGFIVFALLLGVPRAGAKPITVERIVAKINSEIITLSELQEYVKKSIERHKRRFGAKSLEGRMREFRLSALNNLIEQKLVIQRGKKLGITVPDKELERRIQSILDREKIGAKQFDKYLRSQGTSLKAYWEERRNDILRLKTEGREVLSRVSVSDIEIAGYYKANIDRFRQGEARQILQIFFPVARGASQKEDAARRAKADKARRLALSNGKDFAATARKLSEGPNASRGGDLGFIKKGEVFAEFEKILFSMPVGKISDVVRTQAGYHILLVKKLRPGKVTTLDKLSGRLRGLLLKEKRAKRRREWIAELKRAAFLEIHFDPQAEGKGGVGSLEALFRDVREQISFKLIEIKLLKSVELLGREKVFWTFGSSRRDERWKSGNLKVDEEMILGREEIGGLEKLHHEFVNPDPGTSIFLYEYNYLLPNSYLGKVSFADLIKAISLAPKKGRIGVVTDEKRVRLEFDVKVEKTRSIVADPQEFK
ncbi:MAG: peptidylprolyl isomerase [Nitrospinota bacterium]